MKYKIGDKFRGNTGTIYEIIGLRPPSGCLQEYELVSVSSGTRTISREYILDQFKQIKGGSDTMKYKIGDKFKAIGAFGSPIIYEILSIMDSAKPYVYGVTWDTKPPSYSLQSSPVTESELDRMELLTERLKIEIGKSYMPRNANCRYVYINHESEPGLYSRRFLGTIVGGDDNGCEGYWTEDGGHSMADWCLVSEIKSDDFDSESDEEPTCICSSTVLSRDGCQCDHAEWNHRQLVAKGISYVK